ncbi:MAG: FprA family A-type flavoprotein [Dissulfurispiraceae bacterium]|jgi:flavorubredoxin|nr:FprA family A-type flavoprotein [Dissulfurispiraceae bacterium]
MNTLEIKKNIYWVGAIDWAVRDFHGYETPRGTTYNNYLIMDREITLVDAVKHDFSEVSIRNISSITDPSNIKNIVINHIENDHCTGLSDVMALCPEATIYITEKGKKGLDRFFKTSDWNIRIVKTGDILNTGSKTLMFIETPMLHWPDSMMTYVKEDKLLISQDAFGQHIASAARFDKDFIESESMALLDDSVIDYYANILMPFGQLIKNKIADIQKLNLEIDMIAPDHGIIWTDPSKILQMYLDMANGKAKLSVSIIYDTMWHSTEEMIPYIMQGLTDAGVSSKVIKLRSTPYSVALKEFWKNRGTIIGTPTLNNLMYPTVAQFLHMLKGLRPKNRIMAAFGSYGWAGGAVKGAYEEFAKMKLESLEPGIEVIYKPTDEDIAKCREFGRQFGEKVKEYHSKF